MNNTNTTQRMLPIMRQNNTKEAAATRTDIHHTNTNADMNTNTTQSAPPMMRQNNTKETLATQTNIYFANTNVYMNTNINDIQIQY